MNNKIKLIIVGKELISVTDEVYLTYYSMRRHDKYLLEQDAVHKVEFFSNLDTDEITGEDMIPDLQNESVEEIVTRILMIEKLKESIKKLEPEEQLLIKELFYKGKSERQLSIESRIHNMTIHSRKVLILKKLKKLINSKK